MKAALISPVGVLYLTPRPPLHATERGRRPPIKSPLRVRDRMRSIRGIIGVRQNTASEVNARLGVCWAFSECATLPPNDRIGEESGDHER
jgi:hypothetical protein